jgi:SAM-dependent methyltransferase
MARQPSTESYGAFAYAYDQALGRSFFQAVRRVVEEALEKYPAGTRTHLDVACGTGLAVEMFQRLGYRSVGLDASLPMLGVARRRARHLVAADFRALPFAGTFERITCLYDSLNHLKQRDELTAAFRAVRGVMDASSLFLFDMNHPDVYPAVWGMRDPYISTGVDHHLEIATKYRKRERIGYGLVTGWAKLADGRRVEIRETHEQRAWQEHEILDCLREGGLEPVEINGFDPFQELGAIDAETVKLFFVCRAR